MTESETLTGRMLEERGLMTFTCTACRDIFPARCDEHHTLPAFGNHVRMTLPDDLLASARPTKKQPRRPVLVFGQPIAGYTAPYETLEAEISAALGENAT